MKTTRSLLAAMVLSILTLGYGATANGQTFTFVHITDLHVSNVTSLVNSCDMYGQMAQCYLQEFQHLNPKPAFVVATGDISNVGNSAPDGMYPTLTQFLYPHNLTYPGIGAFHIDSAQTIPIYFAPGNHDYYTTLYPPGSMTQTTHLTNYAKYIAPDTDYVVSTSTCVILFVRSGYDIPYWNEIDPFTPDGSGLSDSQCAWIRSELQANMNKRKIIVMHHPPANIAGTNCDGSPYTSTTILDAAASSLANNRTTFLNICDSDHVDVVLAGHQHQNVVTDRNGNIIGENCTTCGTRYVQTGAAFNGCYRIISVSPSFVTVSTPLQSCTSTGIAEINRALHVSVSPNPSNGVISIHIKDEYLGEGTQYKMSIYNSLGQQVYASDYSVFHSRFSTNLPDGIYFLRLQSGSHVISKKIIINHQGN